MIAKKKDADLADDYAGWSDEGSISKSTQPRPAVARGDEQPVHSPAHQLQSRVLAHYEEPEIKKWPGVGRVAVLGAGALGAWALIGLAVVLATR